MRPICPFCAQVHELETDRTCPVTGHEVPASYLSEYEAWPPLWLSTVGFKEHGKTTYLGVLTLLVEFLQNVSEALIHPLDGDTASRLREFRRQAREGWQVERTPRGLPRPLLLHARGLPGIDQRTLVIFDLAGESFEGFDTLEQYAPALRHVTTVWFFVSLVDLDRAGEGRNLQELFSIYLEACRRLRIDVAGRNLVVVFTKADADVRLRRAVADHLLSDPLSDCLAAEAPRDLPEELVLAGTAGGDRAIQRLREVSARLEELTRREVRAGGFVNLVRASGMRLVFTAISALGGPPTEGTPAGDIHPRRVLDPLLWAGSLDLPPAERHVHLVVDDGDPRVPEALDLEALEQELSRFAEVTVSSLGRARPRSARSPRAGAPAAAAAELRAPRLLVPLLARLPPRATVVVLSADPILDLPDLAPSAWPERTLLVSCGDGPLAGEPWNEVRPTLPIGRLAEKALQTTGGRRW